MELPDIELDLPGDAFRSLMHRMSDLIGELSQDLDKRRAFHGKSPAEVAGLTREPLPREAADFDTLFSTLREKIIPHATFNAGPFCNAYVLSPGNQAGVLAEFLAAFLNQNCGKWHLSSIGAEMELLVIDWIREFIGLPTGFGGLLVSGGSMANLCCLAVARNTRLGAVAGNGLFDRSPLVTYVSTEIHHCVIKAIEFLGLGECNIRRIPVNPDYTMNIAALRAGIESDRERGREPFCVAASAGTVNTGAVDDLDAIADICAEHNLWLHVDGAYGAAAADVDGYREMFQGLGRVDSLAIDPHKWNYVPIEAGCSLFRNPALTKQAFSRIPDYLAADRANDRTDFMEHGMQLSRGFKALKIWMTFKAYGARQLKAAIKHDIAKADYLMQLLDAAAEFELLERGALSIVCFRYRPPGFAGGDDTLNALNHRLAAAIEADGRIFVTATRLHGMTALRVCFVNHRAQQRHVERMFRIMRDVAATIDKQTIQQPFLTS